MRGKVRDEVITMTDYGITPAYAGKSRTSLKTCTKTTDHPRLCGEKLSCQLLQCFVVGSPPPMRGKVKATPPHRNEPRITPAYAGKSCTGDRPLALAQDHPRLCGEKQLYRIPLISHMGSPPPMRGKGHDTSGSLSCRGITPAYAGKSNFDVSEINPDEDHPRLCGEKLALVCPLEHAEGSPPPMRGKVRLYCLRISRQRITPAYAGKSDVVHRSTRVI